MAKGEKRTEKKKVTYLQRATEMPLINLVRLVYYARQTLTIEINFIKYCNGFEQRIAR
jgi:hypothetical protein